jgi:3'(2'), 5'-bisphosphate nucleotidase
MDNLDQTQLKQLLQDAKAIARDAGKAILAIYQDGSYDEITKDDETPVTSADYASNDVLTQALRQLTPDIPIISEEMTPTCFEVRKNWSKYWLLDPLDGTQEFISRSGFFAVNIALVVDGWPVLGVIYWPSEDTVYFAAKGLGCFKQNYQNVESTTTPIRVAEPCSNDQIRVAISRVQKLTTVTQYLQQPVTPNFAKYGSCALKSCFVAEGLADCYLRVGPTGEWDTGAPHIIIEEAGGTIVDSEFNPLSYNQRESLKNPDFFVLGSQTFPWHDILIPHPTKREY